MQTTARCVSTEQRLTTPLVSRPGAWPCRRRPKWRSERPKARVTQNRLGIPYRGGHRHSPEIIGQMINHFSGEMSCFQGYRLFPALYLCWHYRQVPHTPSPSLTIQTLAQWHRAFLNVLSRQNSMTTRGGPRVSPLPPTCAKAAAQGGRHPS